MKSNILDKIPNTIIDSHGVFKYIQIYVRSLTSEDYKYVVRGYKKFSFHADNYDYFLSFILIIKVNYQV